MIFQFNEKVLFQTTDKYRLSQVVDLMSERPNIQQVWNRRGGQLSRPTFEVNLASDVGIYSMMMMPRDYNLPALALDVHCGWKHSGVKKQYRCIIFMTCVLSSELCLISRMGGDTCFTAGRIFDLYYSFSTYSQELGTAFDLHKQRLYNVVVW